MSSTTMSSTATETPLHFSFDDKDDNYAFASVTNKHIISGISRGENTTQLEHEDKASQSFSDYLISKQKTCFSTRCKHDEFLIMYSMALCASLSEVGEKYSIPFDPIVEEEKSEYIVLPFKTLVHQSNPCGQWRISSMQKNNKNIFLKHKYSKGERKKNRHNSATISRISSEISLETNILFRTIDDEKITVNVRLDFPMNGKIDFKENNPLNDDSCSIVSMATMATKSSTSTTSTDSLDVLSLSLLSPVSSSLKNEKFSANKKQNSILSSLQLQKNYINIKTASEICRQRRNQRRKKQFQQRQQEKERIKLKAQQRYGNENPRRFYRFSQKKNLSSIIEGGEPQGNFRKIIEMAIESR